MRHSRSTRAATISAVRCAPLTALLALALLASPTSASAETILIGEQLTVRDSSVQHPAAGITMTAVEAQFGAPQERHPSVGEPPITRWDYAGFSVFFEHDRVIHTVIAPGEAPASTTTASTASTGAPAAAEASTAAAAEPTTAQAATSSGATPSSEADAPIEAARPSAPATATASASSEPASASGARLAPDSPLAPDTPVEAPPSSGADTHP